MENKTEDLKPIYLNEEVVVLRQIVKEQGTRIKQLEEEVDKIKELMSRAKLNASSEEVQAFLNYVAAGQQPKAEEMLKKNPEIAQAKGTVTDSAKRTFKDITGFQYAVWALDWHMWKMIRKYLSDARVQAEGFAAGAWVKEHGEYVSWQKLIDAQQTYIDNHKIWDGSKCGKHWVEQVGAAQLNLPTHVLQEYCQPDRPFAPPPDPCPNFNDHTNLVRKVEGIDMQKLGVQMGIVRAWYPPGLSMHWARIMSYSEPLAYPEKEMDNWKNNQCGMFARSDHNALVSLFSTRTQQRAKLVAELM